MEWWHVGDILQLVRVRFQALCKHKVSHVLNRINFEFYFVFVEALSFLSSSCQNEPNHVTTLLKILCGNDEVVCDDAYP